MRFRRAVDSSHPYEWICSLPKRPGSPPVWRNTAVPSGRRSWRAALIKPAIARPVYVGSRIMPSIRAVRSIASRAASVRYSYPAPTCSPSMRSAPLAKPISSMRRATVARASLRAPESTPSTRSAPIAATRPAIVPPEPTATVTLPRSGTCSSSSIPACRYASALSAFVPPKGIRNASRAVANSAAMPSVSEVPANTSSAPKI